MSVTIRPYEPADRAACVANFTSNVPEFFTVPEIDQYAAWLDYLEYKENPDPEERKHQFYFVFLLNDSIIGAGGFGYDPALNVATFAWGFIARQHQKKGYGKNLFLFRKDKIEELFPQAAIVLDTTQHSFRFFEQFGFVTEKYTPDGYALGMHRYDMRLKK